MNRSDTITLIAKALVQAQSEMGNAVKDSKNPFFKSSFATLNAVREACIPVLNKHGVGVFQPTTMIEGKLFLETTLLHESGEFITGLYEVVVGKVNDPQAAGAALSYARRYALQALVNIGADDDDGESTMGRAPSKPYVSSTPNKQYVPKSTEIGLTTKPGDELKVVKTSTNITTNEVTNIMSDGNAEVKPKGGFGVKKEVVKVVIKKEDNEEEWS